ncbi:hypothetical protein IV102_05005 [bacterium]|nr:hypothetical protein [bacterium]
MKRALIMAILTLCAWSVPPTGPIHITAQQSRQKGLPAVGLRLDTAGTSLVARSFPEPGVYLSLSGPPGGALQFQVLSTDARNTQELRKFIKDRFEKLRLRPKLGTAKSVTLAGQYRPTLGFVSGESQASTRWCAVLFAEKGKPSTVALFGVAAGSAEPGDGLDVLAHKELASVARSLKLDP